MKESLRRPRSAQARPTRSCTKATVEGIACRSMAFKHAMSPWKVIAQQYDNIPFYHRAEWYRAAETYLIAMTYAVFFLGDEPLAVFPLGNLTERPGSTGDIGLPVHPEIFLSDCLIAEPYVTLSWSTILLGALRRDLDVHPYAVGFHHTPAGGFADRAFAPGDARVRRGPSNGRAFLSVASPHSLESLSAKHLRNVDRLGRKAERELGSVEHAAFENCGAASAGLDVFTEVEAASWKGPDGTATSLSCQPSAFRFYHAVLRDFGRAEGSRVDVLSIDGTPAAAQIAIRSGATWNLLKLGFHERYASCGPGNILLKAFLERVVDDPEIEEVSLVTNPSWAQRWHMQVEPTYNIAVFARTIRGRARLLGHDALGAVRRLRKGAGRILTR